MLLLSTENFPGGRLPKFDSAIRGIKCPPTWSRSRIECPRKSNRCTSVPKTLSRNSLCNVVRVKAFGFLRLISILGCRQAIIR